MRKRVALYYFNDFYDIFHNPKVTGSSPVPATRKIKASQKCEAFFISMGTE